uniref:Uncharacterized protein n=1 Tax=Romanomermis culicivorax TaxID=13658 RepID=A0A915JWL4_ROMCU
MSKYLQSVAQLGKNPELKEALEQMQTLRQNECERISTAITDCDKQILPQKSTNQLIVSGMGSKCRPYDTSTPPLNQPEGQPSLDRKRQNQDHRHYPQKRSVPHFACERYYLVQNCVLISCNIFTRPVVPCHNSCVIEISGIDLRFSTNLSSLNYCYYYFMFIKQYIVGDLTSSWATMASNFIYGANLATFLRIVDALSIWHIAERTIFLV